ncbi:carbohydrate diacid regulator [Clostridium ragsdalei P11]|uniref:Carbohydrate diacid regulator n=1 Tax=Clostridium ragsdalei P11 TaxID=1353534 RepID=A0A1A6AZR8_9CLOT|nr:sugar diacid recognition domain-containing protein [Clostridium ragsdalei]OBR95525.1 carbohydrate diacid regulator [Clostridium ragsdalei P11]
MDIGTKLAEEIVDRTMKAVNKNINIMNKQGIIIASGNKDRIGSVHEGAVLAIGRKSEFSIDENQCRKLNGVEQGTNIVIEFEHEIVGVIGITGKRDEVIGYGKLIKMTAEMIIEQAYVMKELEWSNRVKEDMILSLIKNDQGSFRLLEKYTKKFKIASNYPMTIFIIQANFKQISNRKDLDILKNIVSILEGTLKESLVAVIDSKTIVLLYKCPNIKYRAITCKDRIEGIYEKIQNQTNTDVKISVGKVYTKLSDMHKSYEIARETLLFGKKSHPDNNVYIFDVLKYEMLFFQDNAQWKINELKDSYGLIELNDKNGELRETLKAFIEENGELNKVSNKLFIHRNTLNYRLNKIYKITNMNPKNYIDLFWLYCSIINFETNKN